MTLALRAQADYVQENKDKTSKSQMYRNLQYINFHVLINIFKVCLQPTFSVRQKLMNIVIVCENSVLSCHRSD